MRKIFSLFIVLSLPIEVSAQDADTILRHRLFITMAWDHTDTRDEEASPLLYFSNGNPIGFGYEYRGNSYRHSFRFSFSISDINAGDLKPDLQNDPFRRKAFFTNASFTYSYLRDLISTANSSIHVSFGGALDNSAFLRVYKYYGGDIYSSGGAATWDELSMLAPEIRADYRLNSTGKILSDLSIPLVSLVGRPGYNLRNTNSQVVSGSNFHLVFLGGLLGWNYSLTFEQEIWDGLLLSASYHSRYYRYTRYGWTSSVLMQDAALQLSWRFGS